MNVNDISNRTIFRILAMISGFIGLVYLVSVLQRPLIWIAIAFFLAVALEPAVKKISHFMPRRSRGMATGVVFLLIIALFSLLIYVLVPPLTNQTKAFLNDLPGIVERMRESDNVVARSIADSEVFANLDSNNQGELLRRISGLGSSVVDVVRGAFGSVVAVITVLALTFFMVVEGPKWLETFWAFQPASKRQQRQRLAERMAKVVTGYTNGRLIIATIAAVVSIVAMLIVGVPYPIPLGIIVGLFGLLPLIGATLGSVVVVLVALTYSVSSAIIMAIFFLVYQQFENTVIQPFVDSKTVQLSPLTAFMAALLGIQLGGILGALIAIPVGACLQILVKEFAKNRQRTS